MILPGTPAAQVFNADMPGFNDGKWRRFHFAGFTSVLEECSLTIGVAQDRALRYST